jgi:hypothetical protein
MPLIVHPDGDKLLLTDNGNLATTCDTGCCEEDEDLVNNCDEFEEWLDAAGATFWTAVVSGVFGGSQNSGIGPPCDCDTMNYTIDSLSCGSFVLTGDRIGTCDNLFDALPPGLQLATNSFSIVCFDNGDSGCGGPGPWLTVFMTISVSGNHCFLKSDTLCYAFPFDPMIYYGPHVLSIDGPVFPSDPNSNCSGDPTGCTWSGGGTITVTGEPC